jgi:hypothetical protein
MKRKIVLAAVLCLAVAALGIGAAPALAAGGCDCHTADPPTATAAHAPLVAGITDCAVCHVDWTVPHPEGRSPWVWLMPRTRATGFRLQGFVGTARQVGIGFELIGHPDVVVHLQQRVYGETEFTDLGQAVTNEAGDYRFPLPSPAPFAAYRVIAQGHVGALANGGTGLFLARVAGPTAMSPELTLKLDGVRNGFVKLGHSVTAHGTVRPTDIGLQRALVRVQKWVNGRWWTRTLVHRALSATGTFSYRFAPRRAGHFRISFSTPPVPPSGTHTWSGGGSPERGFRVR